MINDIDIASIYCFIPFSFASEFKALSVTRKTDICVFIDNKVLDTYCSYIPNMPGLPQYIKATRWALRRTWSLQLNIFEPQLMPHEVSHILNWPKMLERQRPLSNNRRPASWRPRFAVRRRFSGDRVNGRSDHQGYIIWLPIISRAVSMGQHFIWIVSFNPNSVSDWQRSRWIHPFNVLPVTMSI